MQLQANGDSTADGSQDLEGSDVPLMNGMLSVIDPLVAYLVKGLGFQVAAPKAGTGLLNKTTMTGGGTVTAFLTQDDVHPAG